MLSWTNDRRRTFALAAIFSNHLRAVRRLNATKSNSQSISFPEAAILLVSDKDLVDKATRTLGTRLTGQSDKVPPCVKLWRTGSGFSFVRDKLTWTTSASTLFHKTIGFNRLARKIAIANLGGMLRFWLRLWLPLTSMESMEGEVVNSEGYVSWSSFFVCMWERWPNFVRASLRRKGFCASSDYSRINLSPHSHRS